MRPAVDAVTETVDLRHIPRHEPSLWLRNELQAIGQEWADGGGTSCGHYTPRMATALWNRKLLCTYCLHELLVLDPEYHTCDRCRTVAELTVLVIDLGWLLVGLGLCDDCREREVTL
jgi:hypothetical protein